MLMYQCANWAKLCLPQCVFMPQGISTLAHQHIDTLRGFAPLNSHLSYKLNMIRYLLQGSYSATSDE